MKLSIYIYILLNIILLIILYSAMLNEQNNIKDNF